MGQTLAQKILSRASSRDSVAVGDIVVAQPDIVTTHDLQFALFMDRVRELGLEKPWDPDRIIVAVDHLIPTATQKQEANLKRIRDYVSELGIKRFHDVGRHGISHQVAVEEGYITPGAFVVSGDTHALTLGAVGSFATYVNYELPQVLALGEIWLQVPETIRIVLNGQLRPGIMSRDIAHRIIADIGPDLGDYKCIEFDGPALAELDMDQRMTLCNVPVEIGCKAAIALPDDRTAEYLEQRGHSRQALSLELPDPEAEYATTLEYDLSEIELFIAPPPFPHNSQPLEAHIGKGVQQAYIGSCAGGRIEDLRMAAQVMKGKRVHPNTRTIIVPSSQRLYQQALREGLIDIFIDAGAAVLTSSCGPCYVAQAPLVDGETCICTGTRNEPGRKGSHDADIYLANAAVVAASALKGHIADPFDFLTG